MFSPEHLQEFYPISSIQSFSPFQDHEDLGEVYQDEMNQAAMLLYRDTKDQALLMVRSQKKKTSL